MRRRIPDKATRLKAHMLVEAAVDVRDAMLNGMSPAEAYEHFDIAYGAGALSFPKVLAALARKYCVHAERNG